MLDWEMSWIWSQLFMNLVIFKTRCCARQGWVFRVTQWQCFTCSINLPSDPRPTQRSVLSLSTKIYDPYGFLSICMMAKCFMQLLWTTRYSWDQPLPIHWADKWHTFVADTQNLTKISILQAFQFLLTYTIEIHSFADASKNGYATIVYFRCQLAC